MQPWNLAVTILDDDANDADDADDAVGVDGLVVVGAAAPIVVPTAEVDFFDAVVVAAATAPQQRPSSCET